MLSGLKVKYLLFGAFAGAVNLARFLATLPPGRRAFGASWVFFFAQQHKFDLQKVGGLLSSFSRNLGKSMYQVKIQSWKLQQLPEDQYESLRTHKPDLKPFEERTKGYDSFEAFVNEADMMPDWVWGAAEITPVRTMNVVRVDGPLKTFPNKEEIALMFKYPQIHLPGNELLAIRHVCVIEDSCTDNLQSELEAGWQILAVCVRPGNRRPDYVLGRVTK